MSLSRRSPLRQGKPLTRKTPLRNTSSLRQSGRNTFRGGEGGGPANLGEEQDRPSSSELHQTSATPKPDDESTSESGNRWVGVATTARRGGPTVADTKPSIDLSLAARALANQALSAAQPERAHKPVPKPEPRKRPVSKGFPPVVRQMILDRDHYKCVRCGINIDRDGWPGYSLQHRDNRGSGGTSDPRVNKSGNGAVMCGSGTTGCHWWADNHETEAGRLGYVVQSWADSTTVPMWTHGTGWVLLDNNGGRQLCPEPPGGDAHAVAQRKEPWK